jgi:hypothetical protein
MTTDQAVEQTTPEPMTPRLPVPDIVMIDGLRNELGRSHDENVRLRIELEFANQVIASLQQTMAAHSHDHVHEEFEH